MSRIISEHWHIVASGRTDGEEFSSPIEARQEAIMCGYENARVVRHVTLEYDESALATVTDNGLFPSIYHVIISRDGMIVSSPSYNPESAWDDACGMIGADREYLVACGYICIAVRLQWISVGGEGVIGFTVNVNGDVIGRITARRTGVSDIEGDIIGVYECRYIRERSLDNRADVEATIEHHYRDGWHVLLQKCLDAFSGPIQRDWDQRKPKGNSYEH